MSQSVQWYMQYQLILDHVIMATDCMTFWNIWNDRHHTVVSHPRAGQWTSELYLNDFWLMGYQIAYMYCEYDIYSQVSNIRCTKSQNLNVSRLGCSCLCAIYYSQVLSQKWRCSWRSADRLCSNYIWVINKLTAYLSAPYIRDLTVA